MPEQIEFKSIVLDHYSRYPSMQAEDLYKLAHQASMGSEHAVSDIESARKVLLNELRNLSRTPVEPLVDVISPNRSIVRVHLMPYIESGSDPENLLQAFIQTAKKFHGSKDFLRAHWKDIQVLAHKGEIPFPLENLKSFINRMEAENFPAVHHSTQYAQAYHPHYRVVAPGYLEAIAAALPGLSS